MTIQHRAIANAELHEPKDVSTATSGQVYIADGAGSGVWTKQEIKPTQTVYVNSLADFPAAVSGTITLVDNTLYILGADVSTGDRFIVGAGNHMTSNNSQAPVLTYTGTGDMFTGVNNNFGISHIPLVAATCNQVFNFSETGGGGLTIITILSVLIVTAPKFGTFDNLRGLDISKCSAITMADGLTLVGTGWNFLSVNELAITSSSATFEGFDFGTSVHTDINISNLLIVAPAGAIGLKGAASSANVAAGSLANVDNCTFVGGMTAAISGLTIEDIRWEFKGNAGIDDSTKAVDTYLSTATTTAISGIGTFTAIGGTNFLSDVESRFSVTTAGVITYISEVDACFIVLGTATVEKSGGGSDVIAMRIAKQGTSVAKSQTQTQSADPTAIVSQALLPLTLGDTIELMVANNTSTTDIICDDMDLTVSLSG